MSDNGPCLASREFEQFLKGDGVAHIKCTPYHPASWQREC